MSAASNPRASYGTTKKNVPGVIFRAMAMYNGIGDAALFASPPMTMVAFLALISALVLAQQNATETKAKGSAKLRNTKRDLVWAAMGTLRAYVQALSDAMSVEAAGATIQAAGLLVGGVPNHQKETLTATLTNVAGLVHLVANASLLAGKAAASKKTMFNWQWSLDGKTWNDAHSTPYADTDVTGLAPMTTYSFRVSVTVARVAGAWSQPVSILVLH